MQLCFVFLYQKYRIPPFSNNEQKNITLSLQHWCQRQVWIISANKPESRIPLETNIWCLLTHASLHPAPLCSALWLVRWQQCCMTWLEGGVEEKACYSGEGWDRATRGPSWTQWNHGYATAGSLSRRCRQQTWWNHRKNKNEENRMPLSWIEQQMRRMFALKLGQSKTHYS